MKPTIIAHRGNNFSYPENSLVGLRSAFELGCSAVEFDIQMTSDGTLIVLHDDNTLRTSSEDKSALSCTYQELQAISIHEPMRFGSQHNPTPICKLEDALELLKEFPSTHAYIEVKEESLLTWGHQKILDKLIPIVDAHNNQCTIISFDLPVLDLVRQQTDLAIGWVLYHYDKTSLANAQISKPDYLIVDQAELKLDSAPWTGPWKWMIYGVDSADLAFKHYANGIEYIETDYLQRLLSDNRLETSN